MFSTLALNPVITGAPPIDMDYQFWNFSLGQRVHLEGQGDSVTTLITGIPGVAIWLICTVLRNYLYFFVV